jgi:predicted nuclease of predicted toxin-antitoxin system
VTGYPLLTDENVDGPVVEGLRNRGWDVMHATEQFGEKTKDTPLLEYAVQIGRVMASADTDMLKTGNRWLAEGRSFRLIWWPQKKSQQLATSVMLDAFDELARRPNPFASCIAFLKLPKSPHGTQLR